MASRIHPASDLVVSVVSPVRDIEDYVGDYVREVSDVLSRHFKDFEIVLVDNGSRDGTVACIENLQKRIRNIQLYCLARPVSNDSAFVVGLEQAIGDVVVTLDCSCDPPDRILEMIKQTYEGFDIVYGLPENRSRPQISEVYERLARLFYRVYRRLTGESLPFEVSTFRLLSRRALNAFLVNRDRYSLFTVVSAFAGFPYANVTYGRINRSGKAVRVSYLDAFGRAIQILLLSSQRPLRLLTIASLGGALLNSLYAIYVVAVALFKYRVQEGWTTLSLQISGMFFLLFLVLAILSEYVGRLFMHIQNRPTYLIARETSSLVLSRKQEVNVTARGLRTSLDSSAEPASEAGSSPPLLTPVGADEGESALNRGGRSAWLRSEGEP